MGPCLCGDPYCRRCFPGGAAPEECPACGADNYSEELDQMLDAVFYTCGKSECIEAVRKSVQEELEAERKLQEAEDARVAKHAETCTRTPKCDNPHDVDGHEFDDYLSSRQEPPEPDFYDDGFDRDPPGGVDIPGDT